MRLNKVISVWLGALSLLVLSCTNNSPSGPGDEHSDVTDGHHAENTVHLSKNQFDALGMKVDSLSNRNMSSTVRASGQLEVPPQNEASVTAIIGANIASVKVIEGEDVRKGQVLAYLSHPDLTRIQSEYMEAYNNLQVMSEDFERQKKLYEGEVASGKSFQQTRANFLTAQATEKGLASQLRLLGMRTSQIQQGNFYDVVPVVSPIDGSIVKVEIKTGQYVAPEKELFEIVNTHHIHADMMVFEKDIHRVEVGQRIRFRVETFPENELFAEIYSVGKKFEQDPKAVHVHAEIENKSGKLIPGMYIRGEILTGMETATALPEASIVREGDRFYAFLAEDESDGQTQRWMFTPVEVRPGAVDNGWVSVKFVNELPAKPLFAMNNAYYLLAEMKKGEVEHDH